MSQLEIRGLENSFNGWRADRAPEMTVSDAFERYSVELILKDADLSDEEISSGLVGGGGDGGIDGIYFFLNNQLMLDETDVPRQVTSAHLWIIQAKFENGFGETPIQKMQQFSDDLLTFSKPPEYFRYYNRNIKDAIGRFREKYEAVIGQPHTFTISFVYTCKSDQKPAPQVELRVNNLKESITKHMSSAGCDFQFWGAQKLTEAFRSPPNRTLLLDITQQMMADDGSVVCLARLDKFAQFLTDERGNMRQYLLEPNVRDYQGIKNPVNIDIRHSLGEKDVKEFWWLNNGITILADECSVGAGKVKILAPELVNGLQTSHEVFNFFRDNRNNDERTILIRVILPPNDSARRKIIKATNNQTQVSALSLRATEDIHFDIEELFKLYDIYYDRRKGEYRRLNKAVSRIISIKEVAQAVIAIVLQKPDDARARPMSLLGNNEGYGSIFDVNAPRDLFLVRVLLDRQVEKYLAGRADLTKDVRNDVRYHMDTWLALTLAKKREPTKTEIAALAPFVKSQIPATVLDECFARVIDIYEKCGENANASKGSDMKNAVLKSAKSMANG